MPDLRPAWPPPPHDMVRAPIAKWRRFPIGPAKQLGTRCACYLCALARNPMRRCHETRIRCKINVTIINAMRKGHVKYCSCCSRCKFANATLNAMRMLVGRPRGDSKKTMSRNAALIKHQRKICKCDAHGTSQILISLSPSLFYL